MTTRCGWRTAALFIGTLAVVSLAATKEAAVVNVQLQDMDAQPASPAMRISIDHDRVKAGRVTFRAVNKSAHLVHEMIVVRENPKQAELPYDEKRATVVEKRIRHLGEIEDLAPGASGSLTLDLAPGSYLLICNQPGHYKAGMVTRLSVVK